MHAATPDAGAGQGEHCGGGGAFGPPCDSPYLGFSSACFGVAVGRSCSARTSSAGTARVTGQHPQALR